GGLRHRVTEPRRRFGSSCGDAGWINYFGVRPPGARPFLACRAWSGRGFFPDPVAINLPGLEESISTFCRFSTRREEWTRRDLPKRLGNGARFLALGKR